VERMRNLARTARYDYRSLPGSCSPNGRGLPERKLSQFFGRDVLEERTHPAKAADI